MLGPSALAGSQGPEGSIQPGGRWWLRWGVGCPEFDASSCGFLSVSGNQSLYPNTGKSPSALLLAGSSSFWLTKDISPRGGRYRYSKCTVCFFFWVKALYRPPRGKSSEMYQLFVMLPKTLRPMPHWYLFIVYFGYLRLYFCPMVNQSKPATRRTSKGASRSVEVCLE